MKADLALSPEDQLLDFMFSLQNSPLEFAYAAFPWGEKNTELEFMELQDWQIGLLQDLQNDLITFETALKYAMKSGHDVGKSALLCILCLWAFMTMEGTRGRATANTEKQLRTVFWSELDKWFHLCLFSQFFEKTATAMSSIDPKKKATWRIDAMPWTVDNPAAFAGLHNYGKRLIFIFDEAAKIPDVIWEVVDGTMREANTQLLWFVACQPVYNTGRFYECWNKFASSWRGYTIDSRDVRFCNQAAVAQEIADRGGEEDDIVRIRIRGLFPSSSSFQFISKTHIEAAQSRVISLQEWEPLILGIDVARRGGDECVAQFRQGRDARSIPIRRWKPASDSVATMETGNIIASLILQHSPDAVFIDATGYGAGVADFVRHLGHSAISVDFGSGVTIHPNGVKVLNKRAEMFVNLKNWLAEGGCIDPSPALMTELLSLQFGFKDTTGELKLMSKEDMRALSIPSPDWADALALTFAFPVGKALSRGSSQANIKVDYDPLADTILPGHGYMRETRRPQNANGFSAANDLLAQMRAMGNA